LQGLVGQGWNTLKSARFNNDEEALPMVVDKIRSMLSSPSAPERHAGCKVALLLAESFVAANHDIDEGDGLSDEVSPFESFISPVEDVVTSLNPHLRVQVMCDV
jgi:hypothetical protein